MYYKYLYFIFSANSLIEVSQGQATTSVATSRTVPYQQKDTSAISLWK